MGNNTNNKSMLERMIPKYAFGNPVFTIIVNLFTIILDRFKVFIDNNVNEDI